MVLGAEQDFAELSVVEREQGGFDLFGFDFVKLDVGDFFGRDVKFAGGQFAVLVGVDAVEKGGDKFADGLAIGLLLHIGRDWVEIVRGTDCSRIVALDPRSYFRRRRLRIHSYQLARRYFVRSP